MNVNLPNSVNIENATGLHTYGMNNDKVDGFVTKTINRNIKYFPQGIENIFQNLKLLYIEFGRLKEVHQADLKPFPKLISLSVEQNDIEILEEGLFDSNPNLKIIFLTANKIFHIHEDIFNNLFNLNFLFIERNPCIDMESERNSTAIREIQKYIKENCQDDKYFAIHKKFSALLLETQNSNYEDSKKFIDKIQNLENQMENSRIEHAENMREQFELLEYRQQNHLDSQNTWIIILIVICSFLGIVVAGIAVYVVLKRRQISYFGSSMINVMS